MKNHDKKHYLKEILSDAEQAYDEVKFKIHAAGLGVKNEWHGLQDQWLKFHHECTRLIQESEKSDVGVDGSLHVIGKEFKSAFQHINSAFQQKELHINQTLTSLPQSAQNS